MHRRSAGLVFCILVQTLAAQQNPPTFGAVEGTVLGAEEKPLAHAKVSAGGVARARAGVLKYAFTDERGQFFLGAWPLASTLSMRLRRKKGIQALAQRSMQRACHRRNRRRQLSSPARLPGAC
jgi:hypothetical protein